MSYKSQPLQENEIPEFGKLFIHPYLKSCIRSDIDGSQFRVLEWGCGRGAFLASLINEGIDVYGVDVDPVVLHQSKNLFDSKGWNHQKRIGLISSNNSSEYPDAYFDFVYSDQVFEHVSDIDSLTKEMARITKPGGINIHRWPAKWKVYEPHLFMPVVHWFPKGTLRKALMNLCLKIGVEPKWKELDGKTRVEKLLAYNSYSVNKTYYRSLRNVRSFFSSSFDVQFKGIPRIKKRLLASIIYRIGMNHFVAINFQSVIMVACRNDR